MDSATVEVSARPLAILEPRERLEFERHFLWLRLSFLLTPFMLLFGYGWGGLGTALVIVVLVLADCGFVAALLRWRPADVIRAQLVLRLLDVAVSCLVLFSVHRFVGNAYYDATYLFFVVAATATHGRRGTYLIAGVSTLAVFASRLELDALGVLHFERQQVSDTLFYGLLFLATAWVTSFLIRKNAQTLHHRAFHDALTGLPNRSLLHDRIEQAIRAAQRETRPLALLLLDLNRFKEVNDTFGHSEGDLLLQEVGTRLQGVLRESDTVARLGGDEFAILLPATDCVGAREVADKVLMELDRPFARGDHTLDMGASAGIALYPEHSTDAAGLLRCADVAMYAAKLNGSGSAVYAADEDRYSAARLALISDLRRAIEQEQLELHYQPKIDLDSGEVTGVEALARWRHPERGFVPPGQFVQLAEHTGLIKPLTLWVIGDALRQCREWRDAGTEVNVAVNLSARNLHDPSLPDHVAELLQRWEAEAGWLEVEITESAIMADPARAREILTRLHELGVTISIDDFGTGYTSLSFLNHLPVDEIKIDRTFVTDVSANEDNAFIVQSIIVLGHHLRLDVVAEGVEDQEGLEVLRGMKCDVAQGYYLSRPLPADQCATWLETYEQRLAS